MMSFLRQQKERERERKTVCIPKNETSAISIVAHKFFSRNNYFSTLMTLYFINKFVSVFSPLWFACLCNFFSIQSASDLPCLQMKGATDKRNILIMLDSMTSIYLIDQLRNIGFHCYFKLIKDNSVCGIRFFFW